MFTIKSIPRVFSVLFVVGLLQTGLPAQLVSATAIARFVSPSGSDLENNDCSSHTIPCKTIGYTISQALSGDIIRIASGTYHEHLVVAKNLTLIGAAVNTTIIDGSNNGRVFTLQDTYTVDINKLTIQHGNPGAAGNAGGGIENYANLTLTQVKVADNVASQAGGGIYSGGGQLTMTDSLVSGNQTTATGSMGGGLELENSTPTHLTGVTISGNTADESGGGINMYFGSLYLTNVTLTANQAKYGAGLHNANSSTVTILNSTIAHNTSSGNAGGVMNFGAISFTNTIVANNLGNNCAMSGTVTDGGYNLESGSDCGFINGGDHNNADPLLGSLAENGGPTPTMALLTGSPALDAGTNTGCPATDQRGIGRPQGALCDIGSYEADTTPPNTTIDGHPSNPSNDNTPTFAFTGNDGAGSGIASFMCQMDSSGYSACTNPFTSLALLDGSHTFYVYAIDNAGNVDATPASYTLTISTTYRIFLPLVIR